MCRDGGKMEIRWDLLLLTCPLILVWYAPIQQGELEPFFDEQVIEDVDRQEIDCRDCRGGLSFILSTWYNIDNAFSNELEISKRNKWFGVLDEIIKNLITLDRLRSRKDV